MTPSGRVLVLSDEGDGVAAVRVQRPFQALAKLGMIAGYTVLCRGLPVAEAGPPTQVFDFIWVHRATSRLQSALIARLGLPFAYDIDDNLLAVPAYRQAFPPASRDVAQWFLQRATVVCCATPRLAGLLAERAGTDFADRMIVSRNLAAPRRPRVTAGPPRAVVWASSDRPALTQERADIVRAVADHCRTNGLRLVCIGEAPPAESLDAGIEVTALGLLSHAEYGTVLRRLGPAIMVNPLAMNADAETQAFVDGKSDIKALDAWSCGLVGVYSRAKPYLDSDVPGLLLADNTYAGWRQALDAAQAECLAPRSGGGPPAPRRLGPAGLKPLAEALDRVRLASPLGRAALLEAIEAARAQISPDLPAQAFDAEDYLDSYPDVREAIERGVIGSAFEHYRLYGRLEMREARCLTVPPAMDADGQNAVASALIGQGVETRGAADWRDLLLQQVDRLEHATRRTAARLSALDPDRPDPTPGPAARLWRPQLANAPRCPVCEAKGPIPPLLAERGHVLHRCPACRSCFYADRTMPDYAVQEEPGFYQQFHLEQNCSIHHATRFLFMVENPDASVLDVGCGFGYGVDLAAKALGWRAVGIDPSHYASAGRALLGDDIRTAYLTPETALGEPFGLIVASEVIEHVPDPAGFIGLLRRWLLAGRTLILTTPDADAITPEANEADMVSILALGTHLTLFSAESLALLLRHCGFAHVEVESRNNNLVAIASDAPIRHLPEGPERHTAAYRTYLEHLVDTAVPGTALWNGAAGRLMQFLASGGDEPTVHLLFARIAAAWLPRYGIDLHRLRLPEPLPEAALAQARDPAETKAFMWAFGAGRPLNLATVLYCRAVLESRRSGRLPDEVLRWARPAYVHAIQALRVLLPASMIDLDLRATAGRAKLLITDCLVELAPELEVELLLSLAAVSPADRRDWQDVSPPLLVRRMIPCVLELVHAGRLDEARRMTRQVGDAAMLKQATVTEAGRLLEALAVLTRPDTGQAGIRP